MTKLYSILVISMLLSLTGCVTARMQTNIKPDEKPEFKRILVVSNLSKTSPTYLAMFQTAFPSGYQVCTVSNSPISFESPEEAIAKQRQTCQSEVLLTIDFSRNYTTGYGKYISSSDELILEMINLSTGKAFWKALVTTGGNNEVSPRQVVQQLIKDGIITGSMPYDRSYQSNY